VVARQVCFQDDILSHYKLDWAIVGKSSGRPDPNVGWVDASVKEVQDYNLAIAKEVAEAGVNEIQFDYIRFPVENISSWKLHFDPKETLKTDVIAGFLKRADEELKDYKVKIAADVFGIIAWNDVSANSLGQDPYKMAEYIDVIYPMVYPSHFNKGFEGYTSPANAPYFFVQESVKKLKEKMKERADKVEIAPWLQGFSMGVKNYNSDYITKQINAIYDIGVYNYSFWHGSDVDTIIKGVGESKSIDKESARAMGYQLSS